MSNYVELFAIRISHDFFENNMCSCLYLTPTDDTANVIENANLILKQSANGLQILCDKSKIDVLALYMNSSEDDFCFEFKAYSQDSYFNSYTEPYIKEKNKILYFDNRTDSTGVGDIIVSKNKMVSDKDIIALSFEAKEDYVSKKAKILKSVFSRKDQFILPVFYLRIYSKNKKKALLKHWLEKGITTYTVAFSARQTYWKYYLLGESANERTFIIDPEKKIKFQSLGDYVLADNRAAYIFRTTKKIPLQEKYNFRFQLKEKINDSEQVLLNKLPVACLSQTGKEVVERKETVVSEIYINS